MERAYLELAEAIEQSKEIPPCQVTDPEMWFADKGDPTTSAKAKKLCKTCPVINECLTYALKAPEMYGVWGGLSAQERLRIRVKHGARRGHNRANPLILNDIDIKDVLSR
jgi:WhiB family redox-sensing transcriptional regulator